MDSGFLLSLRDRLLAFGRRSQERLRLAAASTAGWAVLRRHGLAGRLAAGRRTLAGGWRALAGRRPGLTVRWPDLAARASGRLSRLYREARSRIQPATAVVVLVGGLVAAAGYLSINAYATNRIRGDLDQAAGRLAERFTGTIEDHVALAESAAALFVGAKATVNRWEFFRFAKTLPGRSAALSAVEWIPRVVGRQRRALERRARADGLFDFRFVERRADGSRRKASRREEYFPIYFIEPYPGNEALLGVDLAADAASAALLARVRDGGKTAAAPDRVTSVGGETIAGFSVIVPVYRSGIAPFTVAERRKQLSGFVRARFRFDRMLATASSGVGGATPLAFYLFDRSDAAAPSLLQFHSPQPGARALDARDAHNGTFTTVGQEVAGWRWDLLVRPVGGAFQRVIALAAWGFVGFTLLLTALLVRYLIKMQVAREKAEAANRTKSEFLAMMCHELRTPLNSVIGFSDMMVNELFGPVGNDHYRDYTTHINRSATHLLGLINTILSFSDAEAGSIRLDRQEFALGELWHSVAVDFQPDIGSSGIELEENLSDTPLRLHADPDLFRQILHNLVSNAVKFTPRGGKVCVTAAQEPDGPFLLRVTDTGIGISEANLDLVLKPFRQVDGSLAREFEGIGLGLPLTRIFVELHGGTLSIESRPNEGTRITLRFPAGLIAADAAPPASPAASDGPPPLADDPPRPSAAAAGPGA